MKNLLKIFTLLLFAFAPALAQVPGTQIPLTGSIGINGQASLLGYNSPNFITDANLTLTATQWSPHSQYITSTATLTATRNLVMQDIPGAEYTACNYTTGGQFVQIIGTSGSGVNIANGYCSLVNFDGTNYIQVGASITGNFYLPSIGGNSGQVYISSISQGSGYTGNWVATATGGGCSTEPVISTFGGYGPYGHINFGLVSTGVGCTSAPSVAITSTNGGTYTTPASVTLALENTVVTINSAGLLSSRQISGTGGIVEQTGPTINNPTLSVPTITGGWGGYGSNGSIPVIYWSTGCFLSGPSNLALGTGCGINFQGGNSGGNYTGLSVAGGGISFLNTTPSLYFKPQLYNSSYPQPSGFVAYLGEPVGSPIALVPYPGPGSGYSGTPVCTIVGTLYGSSSPDTCTAVIYSNSTVTNGIQVTLAGTGLYTGPLPTISVTGVTGGSGFFQYLVYSTPASPSHAFWADPDGSFYANSSMGNYTNPWLKVSSTNVLFTALAGGGSATLVQVDASGNLSSSNTLANGVTATTQASGDTSTNVATDAFAQNLAALPPTISSGAIVVAGNNNYIFCSTTCTVTPLAPAAGVKLCIRHTPGVATVITLAALGSGNYYELTSHAGWGTANHTVTSGGTNADQICLRGYDSNHYAVDTFTGTWTD